MNQPGSGTGGGRSPSTARTTKDLGRGRDERSPDCITEGIQRWKQDLHIEQGKKDHNRG